MTIYVEDWQATYGSPYLVQSEDTGTGSAVLVEDGEGRLLIHEPGDEELTYPIAFVDGVRRGEASLYQRDPASGAMTRGVAGSHACGAVIATPDGIQFGESRVQRLIVWGSGLTGDLPEVKGGWSWIARSVAGTEPDAPLRDIQERMRKSEGMLAEALCDSGYLVVVDGPLTYLRSSDLPVVGYVKTHHRALLEPSLHNRVPDLRPGQRTSLFKLRDRYSCYLRLVPNSRMSGPWAAIVRLEVLQSAGLKEAIRVVNQVAATIPRYAGVPHRDPRAPQNLQPIAALETRLRHLLGDSRLAYRAVREAVAIHLDQQEVRTR